MSADVEAKERVVGARLLNGVDLPHLAVIGNLIVLRRRGSAGNRRRYGGQREVGAVIIDLFIGNSPHLVGCLLDDRRGGDSFILQNVAFKQILRGDRLVESL